jgi:lauroyl/myristoyl acyltransferase
LAFLRLSLFLPLRWRARIGDLLGALYYRGNDKRRRIAATNIALCFPAWTPEQQQCAVRDHFRLAAHALFHIAVLWWGSEQAIDCCLRVKGLQYYEQARAAGRNVIVLHCHAVGLEASLALSRYFPYVGFIKPLKNPVLDFVMTRGRERFGGRVFGRDGGLKPLIRAIKAGYGASYVPDEDLGPKESVYAPFFGVPAATLPTLGRLARITNAVVIPCFTKLLPQGGCELWMEPPLSPFPTGCVEADAAMMNTVIERAVITMPAQYMWTLKRFKTRDDGGTLYE